MEQIRSAPDGFEHLARRQSAGRAYGDAGGDTALKAGHTHHEELVEVAREDRDEFCALEHGQVGILRELQDALVEGQPGELPVEETVGWQRARLCLDGRYGGLVDLDLGLRHMGLGGIGGHARMVPQVDEPRVACG